MGNRFISSIAAAVMLSIGLFFTNCFAKDTAATVAKNVGHLKLNTIKYEKALNLYNKKGALFLDARGAKLYKKGTILGSLNLPVKAYGKLKQYLPGNKATAIVTFCNGFACEKSDELAVLLMKEGYTNVLVYKGGYPEWSDKKQPLMALKKECKDSVKGEYKPKLSATEVDGVKIYLLAEDGKPNEDGVIDQFWFAQQIKNGTVPKGIQIVDVRKPERYAASHIKGAINVPFIDEKMDTSKLPKKGVIVFYCNTGMKSTDARGVLDEELAERVFIFDATYKCDDNFKNCKIQPNEPL